MTLKEKSLQIGDRVVIDLERNGKNIELLIIDFMASRVSEKGTKWVSCLYDSTGKLEQLWLPLTVLKKYGI